MKTTHFISENNIEVKQITTEDNDFLKQCFESDDFKMYITNDDIQVDEYWVLMFNHKRIGCAKFFCYESFGVVCMLLTIYINKEYRFLSASSIFCCFKYIKNVYSGVEKIEMRVYKLNTKCLRLFEFLGIEPEMCIPCKFNGIQTELYYYGFCVEQLPKYKNKLYERFGVE